MSDEGTEGPDEHSGPAEPEGTPERGETAEPRSPSRTGLIVTLVVVLLVIVVGAVWFFFLRGTSLPKTYGPNDAVPYSIGYPEAWKVFDDGTGSVTIAPFDLFGDAGLKRIAAHPEQFQALALSGVDSADNYNIGDIETSGGKLISDTQVQVGGRDARQIEATIPGSYGIPDTHVLFFLIDLGDGKVLAIGFLSSEEGYDAGLFHDIVDSVEIDDAKLQVAIDAYQAPAPFPTNLPTAAPTASPTA